MSAFVTKVTVNPEKYGFIAHRLGAGKETEYGTFDLFAYINCTLVFENHNVIINLL